jgi:hypothetical protein
MNFNLSNIILFVSFMVSITAAEAQKVDFGLKAGICIPSFSLANNIISNPTLSVHGMYNVSYGINAVVKLKSDDNWEIWLEPGFVKKGGMIKYIFHNPTVSIPIESYRGALYSDVELPVIVNFHLRKKFDACVGLGLGYTVSSEHQKTIIINGPGRNLLPDLNGKLNTSIITGINYSLNEYYALTLRYTIGLTKVTTKDLVAESHYQFQYTSVQTSIYSNSLQLSLLYSFNL